MNPPKTEGSIAADYLRSDQTTHQFIVYTMQRWFLLHLERCYGALLQQKNVIDLLKAHPAFSIPLFSQKPVSCSQKRISTSIDRILSIASSSEWIPLGFYDDLGKLQKDSTFTPQRVLSLVAAMVLHHDNNESAIHERIIELFKVLVDLPEGLCFAGIRSALLSFAVLHFDECRLTLLSKEMANTSAETKEAQAKKGEIFFIDKDNLYYLGYLSVCGQYKEDSLPEELQTLLKLKEQEFAVDTKITDLEIRKQVIQFLKEKRTYRPLNRIVLIEEFNTWIMAQISNYFAETVQSLEPEAQFKLIRSWVYATTTGGQETQTLLDFLATHHTLLNKKLKATLQEYGLGHPDYLRPVDTFLTWNEDTLPPPPSYNKDIIALLFLKNQHAQLVHLRKPSHAQQLLLDAFLTMDALLLDATTFLAIHTPIAALYPITETYLHLLPYLHRASFDTEQSISTFMSWATVFLTECKTKLPALPLEGSTLRLAALQQLERLKNNEAPFIEQFFVSWHHASVRDQEQLLNKAKVLFEQKIQVSDELIHHLKRTNDQGALELNPYIINRLFLHALLVQEQKTETFTTTLREILTALEEEGAPVTPIGSDSYPEKLLHLLKSLANLPVKDAPQYTDASLALLTSALHNGYFLYFHSRLAAFLNPVSNKLKTFASDNERVDWLIPVFETLWHALTIVNDNNHTLPEQLLSIIQNCDRQKCFALFSTNSIHHDFPNQLHFLLNRLQAPSALSSIMLKMVSQVLTFQDAVMPFELLKLAPTEGLNAGINSLWLLMQGINDAIHNKNLEAATQLTKALISIADKLTAEQLVTLCELAPKEGPSAGINSLWLLMQGIHDALHNQNLEAATQLTKVLISIGDKLTAEQLVILCELGPKEGPSAGVNSLRLLMLRIHEAVNNKNLEAATQLTKALISIADKLTAEKFFTLCKLTPMEGPATRLNSLRVLIYGVDEVIKNKNLAAASQLINILIIIIDKLTAEELLELCKEKIFAEVNVFQFIVTRVMHSVDKSYHPHFFSSRDAMPQLFNKILDKIQGSTLRDEFNALITSPSSSTTSELEQFWKNRVAEYQQPDLNHHV